MSRRTQILEVAAQLFARRGFHGVSVNELGAACGISGPGLYKHFVSKEAILAAMLESVSEELLAGGRQRVHAAASAAEAVRSLIAFHADFAVRRPELITVQERDWSSLPPDARDRVRALQRAYVALWAEQLRGAHPRLTESESLTRAHAAFGLLNSTPHSGRLPPASLRDTLETLARAALQVEA